MAARKRITAKMIRRHFGREAEIEEKLFGGFRVTTPTGGDLEIDQTIVKPHAGGEDVYRAMIGLCAEAWNDMVVSGPHEHVIASMAHGEAAGVNVLPAVEGSGGCLRFFVATLVFLFVFGLCIAAGIHEFLALIIAGAVSYLASKRVRKVQSRNALRRGQPYRFQYPSVHGDEREASREDAKRKEWL